jgi:hypothetical protein
MIGSTGGLSPRIRLSLSRGLGADYLQEQTLQPFASTSIPSVQCSSHPIAGQARPPSTTGSGIGGGVQVVPPPEPPQSQRQGGQVEPGAHAAQAQTQPSVPSGGGCATVSFWQTPSTHGSPETHGRPNWNQAHFSAEMPRQAVSVVAAAHGL